MSNSADGLAPLPLESFRQSGWEAAMSSASRDGYGGAWQALIGAAKVARASGQEPHALALELLAAACSMTLRPDSPNAPFGPMIVSQRGRSAVPEDFALSQIDVLTEFAREIDDNLLRARLLDLGWHLARPRRPDDARLAVVAYRQLAALDANESHEHEQFLRRAIALSLMLRDSSTTESLADELVGSVCTRTPRALMHSRILLAHHLGRDRAGEVAKALEAIGQFHQNANELLRARDSFAEARQWYSVSGQTENAASVTVLLADTFVAEAEVRTAGTQVSHMVAAHFYEKAIQLLRQVPRSMREPLRVDQKLRNLHASLTASGARSLDEMKSFTSDAIDISEMVDEARAAVQGHDLTVALLKLAHIHSGPSVVRLRDLADNMMSKHPISLLFGASHLSADGRVIAKRPGLSFAADDAANRDIVRRAEMVKYYAMELGLAVQGRIAPALNALLQEHAVREADLVLVCQNSPVVPPGRERLIAKALHAGFERDFEASLHILAPQLEHLVRWHLKEAGVRTTTLDAEGIENEVGLSALVQFAETEKVFGEDLAFELAALFCDPVGPNLRNEVAHGLLDDVQARSGNSVYAWWFTLHLVFSAFWNALRADRDAPVAEAKDSEPGQ